MIHLLKKCCPPMVKKAIRRSLKMPERVPETPLPVLSSPIVPPEIAHLASVHKSLASEQERDAFSRSLMRQLLSAPALGMLLASGYPRNTFGKEELYLQLLGATSFADKNIESAAHTFAQAVDVAPTAFNFISWGRCLFCLGRTDDAIGAFAKGLERHANHFDLTMELATIHYLSKQTSKANACLEQVKEGFATDDFQDIRAQSQRLTEEVAHALKNDLLYRVKEGDVYDDQFVTSCWWDYWQGFQRYNSFQDGIGWLGQLIQTKLANLLEADRVIKKVIDFGVMCAHPNYMVARRFPGVQFYGVDRQELIKSLNDAAFPAPNLHFLAGDILPLLATISRDKDHSVLFHARTGCLCYPAFLRQLYQQCANSSVKYVVMYETLSLSTRFLKFFDYATLPTDAIGIRSIMFNHNYPAYLEEAGYEIIVDERVASTMLLNNRVDLGASNLVLVARKK